MNRLQKAHYESIFVLNVDNIHAYTNLYLYNGTLSYPMEPMCVVSCPNVAQFCIYLCINIYTEWFPCNNVFGTTAYLLTF